MHSDGSTLRRRRARRRIAAVAWSAVAALALAACLPVPAPAPPPAPPPSVPPDELAHFYDSVAFEGLTLPTVVAFSPDGRVFVGEKSGRIKVFDGLDDTTATVFADLSTTVYDYWDRGLLGLALDPSFPSEPYMYVLYAHDAAIGGTAPRWSDGCPTPPGPTTDGCVASARMSRLQASGNQMIGSEQVLVEDWCQQFPSHTVGTVAFGPDGALYAGAGDAASFTFADYGQTGQPPNPCGDPPAGAGNALEPPTAEGGALRSQDLRTVGDPVGLHGSIIRVNPDTGAAMGNNPLAQHPDPNARRIIAYGLRNPFRFTIRPGAGDLWLGEVGWGNFDEINRIPSATDATIENFGWPCFEGDTLQAEYALIGLDVCNDLYDDPSAVTGPYWAYAHREPIVPGEPCPVGSTVLSGLAFYNGGSYPLRFENALFFTDHARGCIWVMLPGGNGLPDPATLTTFRTAVPGPVDLKVGPGGDLFYVDIGGGTVHRIQYNPGAPPTAVLQASASSGPVPTTIDFDAGGSSDPDPGDVLSYAWDLDGDGTFDDSTAVDPSFTYTAHGVYSVRLKVTDAAGSSAIDSQVITISESAPTATIDAPVSTLTWSVGETIVFSGQGTDPEDGTIPASSTSWSLILHHCSTPTSCHEHLVQNFPGVTGGSFVAPDHGFPSFLELRMTVTDSTGLQDVASVQLAPQVVDLTFQSNPTGVTLSGGGSTGAAPFVRTVIVNSTTSVSAPTSVDIGGTQYVFVSWSDGGAATHLITAGQTPTTYTATYTPQ